MLARGGIPRMSRPSSGKVIVGAILAIMTFMLMISGMKLFFRFCQWEPPINVS